MTKIARLAEGYYVNFDDHCLYSQENKRVAKISRKPLEVLEYLCEYPNCYKQIEDINLSLEEGCLSSEAIRSRIFKLRESHDVLRKVVTHDSSGYKYIGKKTERIEDPKLNGPMSINDVNVDFQQINISLDQEEVVAQFFLGHMYENGRGVPKNDASAFEWYQKAANQGEVVSQFRLGFMYDNGRGAPKNDTKAFEWVQRAAERGYAVAQCYLGHMYENGRGVQKNDSKAFEWFQKAADQGNALAQCNLGLMYVKGCGVPQDDDKAFEWFQKAADRGDAVAQCNLGWMYENGCGVPKNERKACGLDV